MGSERGQSGSEHLLPLDPDAPAQGRPRDWKALAAVGAGGALGAPLRYGIAQLVDITPGTFPWGTFWINISGSFALGLFLTVLLERCLRAPPYLRPLLATGFLGAYTTYSTFAVETDLLVRNGHWVIAMLYVGASLSVGLLACAAGLRLGRYR